MIGAIQKTVAPLKRRIMLMVGRAVLHAVDDSLKMQELQIEGLKDEVLDGVESWQPYGFTYHPHPGAEVLAAFLGGNRNHGAVVSVADRRYRLKLLAQGEVAIYDDLGQKVHLTRAGIVIRSALKIDMAVGPTSLVMTPAGLTITAPNIDMNKAA